MTITVPKNIADRIIAAASAAGTTPQLVAVAVFEAGISSVEALVKLDILKRGW